MSQLITTIARHMREIHYGVNWTWSNLKDVLSDITFEEAIAQPIPNGNSIAMLVFHMNYYLVAARNRITNTPDNAKHADSMNMPPLSNTADWQALLQKTWDDADAFVKIIEAMPEEDLWLEIQPDYGSYYRNIHGVIEHNHYHLGQIVILKKLVRS
jgi:uncharacterized damage-inducible protein DinB